MTQWQSLRIWRMMMWPSSRCLAPQILMTPQQSTDLHHQKWRSRMIRRIQHSSRDSWGTLSFLVARHFQIPLEQIFTSANCYCPEDWNQLTDDFFDEYAIPKGVCIRGFKVTGGNWGYENAIEHCASQQKNAYLVNEFTKSKHEYVNCKSWSLDAKLCRFQRTWREISHASIHSCITLDYGTWTDNKFGSSPPESRGSRWRLLDTQLGLKGSRRLIPQGKSLWFGSRNNLLLTWGIRLKLQ